MMPNADLWGLNPQTGRLYSTQERRNMLSDRGVRGNISGPLPSMMWDDYNDRVQQASSGLPEDFRAPVAGGQLDPSMVGINNMLMKRASGARSRTMRSSIRNPADDPESSFNNNPHMRPSVKALRSL